PVKRGYVVTELAAQLAPFLGTDSKAHPLAVIPAKPAESAAPNAEPPQCPKCGSVMLLRTAKSGANAGNRFWGCSNYPTCRTILAYEEMA
ncbi:MAG: topoisomerase DNA-binding C4 zinc finger domain-containing protein, partial [Anaerolineae bacterium]|nr:topoisomerase DNA-binding C4 zinc finger domain-containing protein [Anaerolineae bacterium]